MKVYEPVPRLPILLLCSGLSLSGACGGPSSATEVAAAPRVDAGPAPVVRTEPRADEPMGEVDAGQPDSPEPAINEAPTPTLLAVAGDEDSDLTFTLTASDRDEDTLTFELLSAPCCGELDDTALPHVVFTPAADWNGETDFSYRAHDGTQASVEQKVTLRIRPVNDAPRVMELARQTQATAPLDITLMAHDIDGDALHYSITEPPAHGSLSGDPPAMTYVAERGFEGADRFEFTVSDGSAESSAIVAIDVLPPPDRPMVTDDSYEVLAHHRLRLPAPGVLANDSSAAGELTVVSSDSTSMLDGNVQIAADGSVDYYAPMGQRSQVDSFTYTVEDQYGQQTMGVVRVTLGDTLVWYVDNSATSRGDGRVESPFNDLSGACGHENSIVSVAYGEGDPYDAADSYNTCKLGRNQSLLGAGELWIDGILDRTIAQRPLITANVRFTGGGSPDQPLKLRGVQLVGRSLTAEDVDTLIVDNVLHHTMRGGNETVGSFVGNAGATLHLANVEIGEFSKCQCAAYSFNGFARAVVEDFSVEGVALNFSNVDDVTVQGSGARPTSSVLDGNIQITDADKIRVADLVVVTNRPNASAVFVGSWNQAEDQEALLEHLWIEARPNLNGVTGIQSGDSSLYPVGRLIIRDTTVRGVAEDGIDIDSPHEGDFIGLAESLLQRVDIAEFGGHGISIGAKASTQMRVTIQESRVDMTGGGYHGLFASTNSTLELTVEDQTEFVGLPIETETLGFNGGGTVIADISDTIFGNEADAQRAGEVNNILEWWGSGNFFGRFQDNVATSTLCNQWVAWRFNRTEGGGLVGVQFIDNELGGRVQIDNDFDNDEIMVAGEIDTVCARTLEVPHPCFMTYANGRCCQIDDICGRHASPTEATFSDGGHVAANGNTTGGERPGMHVFGPHRVATPAELSKLVDSYRISNGGAQ